MHISIVLPAYNEQASLPSLLQRIDDAYERYGWDASVLVVNDGSTDDTLAVARGFRSHIPIDVVDVQPNRGLANAVDVGLRHVAGRLRDTDVVVTLDADDSHDPCLIQPMVQRVAEGSDVVIASRYQPGARVIGLRPSRRFLSWGAGMLFRVFVRLDGVRDYTCGFRAYKVEILKRAMHAYRARFITEQGFGCMVEMLLKVAGQGATISELPMILRYDLKQGGSKMNVQKTIRQTLELLFDYARGRMDAVPTGFDGASETPGRAATYRVAGVAESSVGASSGEPLD